MDSSVWIIMPQRIAFDTLESNKFLLNTDVRDLRRQENSDVSNDGWGVTSMFGRDLLHFLMNNAPSYIWLISWDIVFSKIPPTMHAADIIASLVIDPE